MQNSDDDNDCSRSPPVPLLELVSEPDADCISWIDDVPGTEDGWNSASLIRLQKGGMPCY